MERISHPFGVALVLACALCGCRHSSGSADKKDAGSPAPATELTLDASATADSSGKPNGREAADLDDGRLKIWYADLGDSLGIRVQSRLPAIIHADFNQDGVVEKGLDRSFGVFGDGSSCVQFEHDPGESADCGQAPSAAKTSLTMLGDTRDAFWRIPKSELGAKPRTAWVSFELYDPEAGKSVFYPAGALFAQTYKLSYGKTVLLDHTAAAPAVPQRQPAQARDGEKEQTHVGVTGAVPPPATPPADTARPPVITSFLAEPSRINAGETIRLAWSVDNAANVTIDPGLGDQHQASGEISLQPTKTTEYKLVAVGTNGAEVSATRAVEVLQRVEIVKFAAANQVVGLDDKIRLHWETKAATRVTLRLRIFPPGSRFQFPETVEPATGDIEIPVTADQFTRYGSYAFELAAEGTQGPISRIVTILLKQK